jgi:hypothetical protein
LKILNIQCTSEINEIKSDIDFEKKNISPGPMRGGFRPVIGLGPESQEGDCEYLKAQ